jgi:hypothetical protein
MEERRTQKRIDCDLLLNKVQNGHTNVVRARDISIDGIRLQRLLEPAIGTGSMRLQFTLEDGADPIWVGARVQCESVEDIGVRFTDISHQHFVRLREWLQS